MSSPPKFPRPSRSAEIREEVLYREGLAIGLVEDDTIVRRRVAQKVEFLFKDLADAAAPTDEELLRFLRENPEESMASRRTSFVHIYLSVDKRGANAETDAQRLLSTLTAGRDSRDPSAIGDPFMVGYKFENQSDHQLARMLGLDFPASLGSVEPGSWRGPIVSCYGLHLVFVRERTEPRLPPLAEIRERVLYELQVVRRREAN